EASLDVAVCPVLGAGFFEAFVPAGAADGLAVAGFAVAVAFEDEPPAFARGREGSWLTARAAVHASTARATSARLTRDPWRTKVPPPTIPPLDTGTSTRPRGLAGASAMRSDPVAARAARP